MRPPEFENIGHTISILRKRAGLTQRAIAEELGISDKAFSKWERGLAAPDIVNLNRLAVLLDTDIESILSGNVYSHGTNWCGVLSLHYPEGVHSWSELAGKPLIYLSLSYFLLVGIRDIIFFGKKEELDYVKHELEPYAEQIHFLFEERLTVPEKRSVLIEYAPVFLYGKDLTQIIGRAMASEDPVCLENQYARNPEIPLLIFPDGVSSRPGDIRDLKYLTRIMKIERGILSLPITSKMSMVQAERLVEDVERIMDTRSDDIDDILQNRNSRSEMAK